jgi:hypothetical protein
MLLSVRMGFGPAGPPGAGRAEVPGAGREPSRVRAGHVS